ncbi:MAG: DNA (cytosine-5-)-methyltransferase [Candidatus Saganbacteria bacterium]|nr:DNA (cytosine-5-)-methyltransferase [Candidatus Saganbacteria bacterium]
MEFRLGELFCGPGGLALAAQRAEINVNGEAYSIKTVWANDYDEDTCETYRNNIRPEESSNVVCKDVRKLDLSNLPEIDALSFGFPCNDFSVVGQQRGVDGLFGPLYAYGVEALNYFQPKWFLAENVGGLRNANEGNAFKAILNELFNAGYNVFPHLYKFEYYGVPQARHRIIIIGIRNDLDYFFRIPSPTTIKPLTSKHALENPPIPTDASNNELTKQSDMVVERLKYIRPGENVFTAKLPDHLKLNISGAKISQIYKRLDPDKPAYTITGSGGGGTHVYHWKFNRALTNRERARLQTFPDDFVFSGSKESVRKQIGMAVSPMAAKVIFRAVLSTFAGIEYEYCEPNFEPLLHEELLMQLGKGATKELFKGNMLSASLK